MLALGIKPVGLASADANGGLPSYLKDKISGGENTDTFGLGDRGRIRAGAPVDLVLVQGKPDEVINDTQAVQAVWKNGRAVTLGASPGSAAETAGIEFLHQQTQRVTSVVLEKFPEFAARDGSGPPNRT